ncbi:MAG: hypothetical protein ABFD76_10170 [Smithella sp.]
MNRKYIDYLLIFVLALWLLPRLGSDYYPQIFAIDYVQWTLAIFLAVLIPVGTLLTIFVIRQSNTKRLSLFISLIFFTVPLLANLFSSVIPLAVIVNVKQVLYETNDNLAIRSLSECSHNAITLDKRKKAAQYLYRQHGIKASFIDENNTLKIYGVTKQDEDAWEKRKLEDKEISDKKEQINRNLKTLPWLFTLYTAAYAIIMIVGAAILIFRNPVKKQILPDA